MLFFAALLVSWALTFPVIWGIKAFHLAQYIRAEGPASHQSKAGTPTMGGIGFVLTIVVLSLIFIDFQVDSRYLALVILVAGYGLIGLVDELLKQFRRQNLGLTFWQKIIAQTLVATCFAALALNISDPLWLIFFFVFIIVGAANAANLTDGLNGLLAGTGGIAYLAFAILAVKAGQSDLVSFCLISAGAILAFLYFNFPNAVLFMGDVGSLPIGAGLAGAAILLDREWSLAVIGGVFVIEALSVILQVASFKLLKRRIFRMSPLHHHFELLGISEKKVTIGFWIAGAVLAVIGVICL